MTLRIKHTLQHKLGQFDTEKPFKSTFKRLIPVTQLFTETVNAGLFKLTLERKLYMDVSDFTATPFS